LENPSDGRPQNCVKVTVLGETLPPKKALNLYRGGRAAPRGETEESEETAHSILS